MNQSANLNASEEGGRPLAQFTVELDVYSGPYEWLLALILKEEIEIFEVPLREIVDLYLDSRPESVQGTLERDTEFVGSAASLVLLKSRMLFPALDSEEPDEEMALSQEQLADRLAAYLKVKRGAEHLRERFESNAGYYASAHSLRPRPGRFRIDPDRLQNAARRTFSRIVEPPTAHLGPITLTIQELAALIRTSLVRGPLSYEDLVRDMDRLHAAVAFAASLSLANEGHLSLSQPEPLGPLTFLPTG